MHVSLSAPFPHLPTKSTAKSGATRGVLRHVRRQGVNLALWERALPPEVGAFCAAFIAQRAPVKLDVTAAFGPALLAALATQSFFRDAFHQPELHWLLEDLGDLATDFASLADCCAVRVRLTRVPNDGCAVFHVDTLPIRLLCTYAGAGTQWADEPDVRRAELGLRNRTTSEVNAAIVPDAACIRTMPTGAVAVFKGQLWPGAEGAGLVHRSHPVCCADHARLRLVIDPAGFGY